MSNNGDLITVPQGEIVSTDIVNQIALRLQKTYQLPKKRSGQTDAEYQQSVVQTDDFPIVVELAMAQGHNPLSKTFHYWKQNGNIMVDDHYAPLMNWAQSKGAFTYETETLGEAEKVALEGVEANDYVVRFKAMRRADQGSRQILFKTILDAAIQSGKDLESALSIAEATADRKFAVVAYGVVKYNELHYKSGNEWVLNTFATPKGWLPGIGRAETRAIRNGIKKMVGMPMPEERRRLGIEISMPELAQIAAEMPPQIAAESADVRERYMRLEAQNRQLQAIVEALPTGELSVIAADNNDLLYGKREEDVIGEEVPMATKEQTLAFVHGMYEKPTDPSGDYGMANPLGPGEDYEDAFPADFAEDAPQPENAGDGSLESARLAQEEYNNRTISVPDALRIALLSGYKNPEAVDYAIRSLFGKKNIGELNEIELWNFSQYAQRRAILYNTNLPIEYRLSQIPEIESSISKPKTVKDAHAFIHNILKTLTGNGKKLNRLQVEKEAVQ